MKTTEQLQSHVVDELAWDPKVDSSNIAVTVSTEGVITLKGSVRNYPERRAAETAVKRVQGVRGLANDLAVMLPPKYTRDDSAIAGAAANALKWTTSIPEGKVKVTVSNGWVTLDGEVEWQFQKQTAFNVVRDLLGVKGVTNDIRVKPMVRPAEVKQKIEDAFKRSAEIDADHVRVEAIGGSVTLRGTVRSWAERREAENAAWSAPGVTEVKDLLGVQEAAYV
jgi:osmotically-inducible protein OsmY